MSPRWFNLRTYRIVASGRSVLTFNAADQRVFSVNDNSVRLPFHSKSDSELPRHFLVVLKARLGYERSAASTTLPSARSSFVPVFASRCSQLARLYAQIENGADAGLLGITCYMVRPTARCMYWH